MLTDVEKPIAPIAPLLDQQNDHHNINDRLASNIRLLQAFKQGDFSLLKNYSGFGGLRQAFKQEVIQNQLASFLTSEEIEGLRKSASSGYFTPSMLIDFIYGLVQKLGFTQGNILEPACGHGAFFERMPKVMRENSKMTGLELEKVSADIAQVLYPDVRVLNQGFQHFHENEFDLIIGNPPYAAFSVFDEKHPDLKHHLIHHYFVAKSARLLKEGGLLAMVVPYYVLDVPKNHLREQIAEVANLVAAYRMPSDLFENAKMVVDVIILQKTSTPQKNWTKTVLTETPGNDRFYMNQYFLAHPEHVLGKLETYQIDSYYKNRPRRGLNCIATIEDVQKKLPDLIRAIQPLVSSNV